MTPFNYSDFTDKIIDAGIEAASKDYRSRPDKLRGAMAGFNDCRGKSPDELRRLLSASSLALAKSLTLDDYAERSAYHAEVEWVCNCYSAVLASNGQEPIVIPTARGTMKAMEIAQLLFKCQSLNHPR
jgi:hypothetical protein